MNGSWNGITGRPRLRGRASLLSPGNGMFPREGHVVQGCGLPTAGPRMLQEHGSLMDWQPRSQAAAHHPTSDTHTQTSDACDPRYMNQYEDALLSGNLTAINEYLDWPAAIDYFLGTEITKTPDGYRWAVGGRAAMSGWLGGRVGGPSRGCAGVRTLCMPSPCMNSDEMLLAALR